MSKHKKVTFDEMSDDFLLDFVESCGTQTKVCEELGITRNKLRWRLDKIKSKGVTPSDPEEAVEHDRRMLKSKTEE